MIEGKKREKQKREKPKIWVDIGAGSNSLGT
jgi:hypothetical protein